MATKTKNAKKQTPAKKKETNKKKALPKAATTANQKKAAKPGKTTAKGSAKMAAKPKRKPAKAALKTSASKTKKTIAQATRKKSAAKTKKTPAKAAPKTASAKKKSQPFVKSKNTKSTAKTTVKPTAAKKTARGAKPKVAQTAKAASTKSGGARKIAEANRNGQKVAARRADKARPVKEKKEVAAKKKTAAAEQKPASIPSETAAKVAKTLIRRKAAAKKGDARKPKPARPIAFTLDEALEIAKTKPQKAESHAGNGNATGLAKGNENQKKEVPDDLKQENRTLGAASISDILGYNPNTGPKPDNDSDVPPKFARYYKLLLELRQHVVSGLDIHTKETLKRSSKEDTGNLSAYSQHMADAGTDTFDRDFALSLVSSEQDALYEIEDAIRRIKRGSYGICEITGKPIKKERLLAVPFAKFSVEGQVEYERTHRKSAYRGGAFGDSTEESVKFMDEDSDE